MYYNEYSDLSCLVYFDVPLVRYHLFGNPILVRRTRLKIDNNFSNILTMVKFEW